MTNRRTDYSYSSNTDTSVIYGMLQYTDKKALSSRCNGIFGARLPHHHQ